MSERVQVSFKLSKAMQIDFRKRMIDDGYGLRGKSRWVSEAVERLLEVENYPEYVHLSEEMTNLKQMETIFLDRTLIERLEDAILAVRTKFPLVEGVRSCILRTSIMQRLLRG
ncbi:MAG: hypothetical protein U1E78_12230 [Gammaproteobacteria bacterium]